MSALNGIYFDGVSARGRPVRVTRLGERLLLDGDGIAIDVALAQVRVSPRLGRTRRQLLLDDGAVCELDDTPVLDDWFAASGHRRANLLARLEAHWGVALAAFALVIGLSVSLAIWGMPWIAERVAMRVPADWVRMLGSGTLAGLDKTFGSRTSLTPERRAELRTEFAALATSAGVDARFEFRKWRKLGANALALPDGTIVVTDGLVALAEDDRELLAVVAHELGHVHERHALRQVIAGSGVAALVFVLTGDVSGFSQIVVAAPTVLTQMRHSRELESDADRFAFALLSERGQDPAWFARIIRKLEKSYREEHPGEESSGQTTGWLSSHPASEQRARLAEEFASPHP